MKKRSAALSLASAAAMLLVLAAPAFAARAADTGVPYGWLLQLRGIKAKQSMPSYKYQAWQADPKVKATVVDDNKTADDPSDDLTYTGVALWRLVGRIDGGRVDRFDRKLATTAPGYTVVIEGVDGFTVRYTSLEVATLKNALVVADLMNGEPLTLGTASIKNPMTVDEYASWKPNWPLKLVSSDTSIFGSRKPAGVQRISIEPTTAPGAVGADTGVPYGWLLQLRGIKAKQSMPSYKYQAWQADPKVKATVVDDNKTADDPSDDLTYTGVALWRLVGRIDGGRVDRFDRKLATTAPGYTVGDRGRRRLHRPLHEPRGRHAEERAGRRRPDERRAAHARHRLHQEPDDRGRVRLLEAQLAAQAGLQRHEHLRQPQAAGVQRISIEPVVTQQSPF